MPAGDVTVLPAFPLAYYLSGRRNPLPLDWPLNLEGGASSRYAAALGGKAQYAVVDMRAAREAVDDGPWGIPAMRRVREEWRPVASGGYFATYENPAYR
jgi:hypothetical protein